MKIDDDELLRIVSDEKSTALEARLAAQFHAKRQELAAMTDKVALYERALRIAAGEVKFYWEGTTKLTAKEGFVENCIASSLKRAGGAK